MHATLQQSPLIFAICYCLVQNDYKGRKMHPTVKQKLRTMYLPSNRKLYEMLQRDMAWGDMEKGAV